MKNADTQISMFFTSNEYSAPIAIEKSKSWWPFWSYQLNSTSNPAHLLLKWAKWAELAVLFSWQLQNGPRILIFKLQWVPSIHLR
jgi:hypothetical protein